MSNAPNMIGVRVAMQSAIAAAKTVTAVTQANPGVATSTTHGFVNGDYLLMTAVGMIQIDDRVVRVSGSAASTFNLEGEDTTAYDAFVSGTAQKLTFGNTFSTLADISATGGDYDMVDNTTIHDLIKTQEPGMASGAVFTFESHWDLNDATVQAAIAASKAKSPRAFLFTFLNGYKMAFYGFIGASGIPKGSAGQKVKTSIVITANSAPTYYAT
jgi:hypothetical protein